MVDAFVWVWEVSVTVCWLHSTTLCCVLYGDVFSSLQQACLQLVVVHTLIHTHLHRIGYACAHLHTHFVTHTPCTYTHTHTHIYIHMHVYIYYTTFSDIRIPHGDIHIMYAVEDI